MVKMVKITPAAMTSIQLLLMLLLIVIKQEIKIKMMTTTMI